MDIYVDMTFYKNVYMGTTIPDNSFDEMAKEASRYIYKITNKTADKDDSDIKMATCEVAEVIYKHITAENKKIVSSESLGPISKSYKTEDIKTDEEKEVEKYKVVLNWLGRSPKKYLHRGAKVC